jgi:hypothetical protein
MPAALAPSRLCALCAVALASLTLPAGAVAKKTASPKLPAKFAKRYHVKSAVADPDRDGLTNYTEYRAHTNPKKADSDKDGTADGSEDFDKDQLDNATEQRAGTDAGRKDSDRDGKPDAREDADHDGLNNLAEENTANDPGDPDSDDDGVKDGSENAGQVVSFGDDGVLALRLASTGRVVRAEVDGSTSVECSATEEYEGSYDDDAGEDTSAVDEGEDLSADDDVADDDAGDDESGDDDAGDDDAEASAARVVRADEGDDDPTGDYVPADEGDDVDSGDDCVDAYLDAGAWVHEATLATDDGGAPVFDAVALVADGQ